MTPEVAKVVHRYFDQDAINIYVVDRINRLHANMEFCRDIDELRQTQGAILELRGLLKAKEYAENVLKGK